MDDAHVTAWVIQGLRNRVEELEVDVARRNRMLEDGRAAFEAYTKVYHALNDRVLRLRDDSARTHMRAMCLLWVQLGVLGILCSALIALILR